MNTIEDVVQAWLEGSLERGDRGPDVEQAQRILQATGAKVDVDGKLGPKTQAAIEAASAKAGDSRDVARVKGPVPLVTYLDSPRIDAGPTKHFSRRPGPPQVIVLHWPGFVCTASQLGERWLKTSRAVSSHLGVDHREIVQYLPLSVSAWHAGWINRFSIGIDICQSPDDEDLADETRTGKSVIKRGNHTGRGSSMVLSLDPRVRANTLALVEGLCEQFNIPLQAPRGGGPGHRVRHDVVFRDASELGRWRGVIGHHHCHPGKWDIAPWWQELFAGTPLGDAP